MSDTTLTLTGKIKFISEPKQIGNNFVLREFALDTTTDPKFPKYVVFQCAEKAWEYVIKKGIGDEAEVKFEITSQESKDRHFTNAKAWAVK